MSFNPKDALESAKDIATHSVAKATEIADHAGEVLKGDVVEGATGIVQKSMDIASHAVHKAGEIVSGREE